MIPGGSLLGLALNVTGTQTVTWHSAAARTQNDAGQWVTTYDIPVRVRGSWQSVERIKYQALGLDLAKTYFNFYSAAPIKGAGRGTSPDLLDFNGRRHEVINVLDWAPQDGWCGVTVVDVGPAP